jgi:hypothetical protein
MTVMPLMSFDFASLSRMIRWFSSVRSIDPWFELMDTGAALRKLDYEDILTTGRHGGVMALLSGRVDGEERATGVLGFGGTLALIAPGRVWDDWLGDCRRCEIPRMGVKVFLGESLAFLHQRRQCLWVLSPSWGRHCG